MLALSLLLSATAGVNAMLGSDIKAVTISSTTYFCPNDCTFGRGFFQRVGHFCLDNEIVSLSDGGSEEFYACNGTAPEGWQVQPNDGLAPECDLETSTPNDPIECYSDRAPGEGKIVPWSELEKILESAS
ncbi:hypothetical protein MHUMG1_09973 [Metarhizium humberi]|uniref:Uncharacterized protein n=1 Tax=Metarhizium humberi TaxID=2596975 RepID=A0A9P8M2F2_9HYPO|nr:hypothetical protein MHUMG1_09973 [Metarhizium humberi]